MHSCQCCTGLRRLLCEAADAQHLLACTTPPASAAAPPLPLHTQALAKRLRTCRGRTGCRTCPWQLQGSFPRGPTPTRWLPSPAPPWAR